jgi:tRNA threonylcarbamoyladenosine biosynthesis protein TsaB
MTILGIDTSTSFASIALFADGLLAESTWRTGKNHTVHLATRVADLLRLSGKAPSALSGIAVAIGPGSFTGVRVGVALAKSMAHALHLPLLGVPTLEVAALEFAWFPGQVRPMVDGGRGQVATALYVGEAGVLSSIESPRLADLASLLPADALTLYCGELSSEWVERIVSLGGPMACVAPVAARVRRAAFLAEEGSRRVRLGLMDDASALQPIYLRRPAILDRLTTPFISAVRQQSEPCPT